MRGASGQQQSACQHPVGGTQPAACVQDVSDPQGQLEAAHTLKTVARTLNNGKHCARAMVDAALPALISLLQRGAPEQGREQAALVLGFLACNGHRQLVADAALQGLLALAQVWLQQAPLQARLGGRRRHRPPTALCVQDLFCPAGQAAAAWALVPLAMEPRPSGFAEAVLPAIAGLLQEHDNDEGRGHAAWVLATLAMGDSDLPEPDADDALDNVCQMLKV